nr:MAG TPA: hypothetical protein [Microviridae sp.]
MGWNPFNAVKKYVSNPMTWLTGGTNVQLDLADKGLRRFGVDIFGNKQQEFNNNIAQENNQLQKDSYNFNKNLASETLNINKDVTYNGSQIKSADMAKAGLNPLAGVNASPSTISSSNVSSPNLSQPNLVAQTELQKIQTVAGLAMQAKQLQSSLASSAVNDDATKAQTRYQQLVNDYFEKHGVLPTQQNEWVAQLLPLMEKYGDTVKGLPQSFIDSLNNFKAQKQQEKIDSIVQKNEQKTQRSYNQGKTDSYYGKKTINSAKYEISKYPPNEKGFIDWRNSRQGQEMIKLYGYSSAREYFFEESNNFRKYNK